MIFAQIANKKEFISNFDFDTTFSNINKNYANKKKRRKKFKEFVIRKCVKIKKHIKKKLSLKRIESNIRYKNKN